ncbi:hypothetical protein EG329_003166 [Mollisiaceae sp. DMI_Dod_QoI]|nr:hypothetical protein EG329_003166 [Helotiales sp. DMI_Dod_QoI]
MDNIEVNGVIANPAFFNYISRSELEIIEGIDKHRDLRLLQSRIHRGDYYGWIQRRIEDGCEDRTMLDFLIDHHFSRGCNFEGYTDVQKAVDVETSFLHKIRALRKQAAMKVEDEVQQALQEHRLCLPTERSVSRYLNEGAAVEWKALRELCTLQYWNRLWIVQEMVLARDVVFQVEGMTFRWGTLADIFLYLKYTCDSAYKRPSFVADLLHTPAARIISLRREYVAQSSMMNGWKGFGLSMVLAKCRNSSCRDPRDKIYGLIGIARDSGLDIYPDYLRSTLQLYEAVMLQSVLWKKDQLVWFSAFIQQQLGGIPRDRKVGLERVGSPNQLCRTLARSNGEIFVLGDLFTSLSDSKAQIQKWQALYYHRILSHDPVENLSVAVGNALERMGHDYGRVIDIESHCSHIQDVPPEKISATWDSMWSQYTDLSMPDRLGECEMCSKLPKQKTDEVLSEEDAHQKARTSFESQTSDEPKIDSGQLSQAERTQMSTAPSHSTQPHIHLQPRWMMGSRGQIGLVPHSAKEGDFIYHFKDTDIVAVICRDDPQSSYYSLVGSALMLRRWDEEEVRMFEDSGEIFHYSLGPRGRGLGRKQQLADVVEFHLDLEALRLLTSSPYELLRSTGKNR